MLLGKASRAKRGTLARKSRSSNRRLAVTVPVAILTVVAITRFQPRTTATRAAVIYSAEPLFAFLCAALWLNERLDPAGAVGAALIVGGILLAEVK